MERMRDRRREGGIQRRPTFYEGAGGTAGKVYRVRRGRKEGRKEGPTPRCNGGMRGKRHGQGVGGSWRFLFKQHQRACRKFSTVPAPYPSRPGSYETVFHLAAYTRVYMTRVPGRSSGVSDDSLGHRRMVNVVVSGNGRRRPPPLKG